MTSTQDPRTEKLLRIRDVTLASVALILLLPVLMLILTAVRIAMGSPVLYRQSRLGRGGAQFNLLKVRTMRVAEIGYESCAFDALRLTPLGRFLRRTSLDELPSLINVLRGELALVGPRPLPIHYWSRFVDDEYRRFEVRPGITGRAQIEGRNTLGWTERLALDVQYVQEQRLVTDVAILIKTIPVVLGGHGVNEQDGITMSELPERRFRERRAGVDRGGEPRGGGPDRRTTDRRATAKAQSTLLVIEQP